MAKAPTLNILCASPATGRLLATAIVAASLTWSPSQSEAAAGFSAGYKVGTAVTCASCEGAAESAFAMINQALVASEISIGNAINDGPFYKPAPIGFPAVKTALEVSASSLNNVIASSFTALGRDLSAKFHTAEAVRVANKARIQTSPIVAGNDEGGCQSLEYGRVLNLKPRSSLGWGYQYVLNGKQASSGDESVGDTITPPAEEVADQDGVIAAMSSPRMNAAQVMNQEFNELQQRSEDAGEADASIPKILSPEILYGSAYRTFDVEPDLYGISDDERADYLIQYLSADAPTYASEIAKSANTPAELQYAVDGEISNIQLSLSMAVLDEQIKLRRPRSSTTGADAFLASAMGEEPDENSSRDDFFYRLTHYRQRDPAWVGRMVIDHDYALAQQVQMEAEQLAVKFERWKTKRQSNLLLAQAVAKEIAQETE